MALDLVASLLVGLLAVVSAVLFVRGLMGMLTNDDSHYPHYHL